MDTNSKEETAPKKRIVTWLVILAVVIGLIVIAVLLTNSGFDFVEFMKKLHGG